jgi:hypothetical protein
LSGSCKIVILLTVVAVLSLSASRGQAAPAKQAESTESSSAESASHAPGPDDSCDDDSSCGWTCSRPLCLLLGRLKADCGPIPWANWTEHPLSVGCFAGVINGGPLIKDWAGTTTGFNGGWRLGWDMSPNWGSEMRFSFGSLQLYDSYRADQALASYDDVRRLRPDDPQRARNDFRNATLFQWDVDVLYYPWGETRLRPYFFTGMGLTDINFSDRLSQSYHSTCLSLPLGLGVKYLCSERLAVRLDCIDDIALSSNHLQTQNNLSLTAGVEMRFGGSRKVYWPWDPGRQFW